jgi:FdhD protein
LRDFQPLGRETGATHAAAWAGHDGEIALVREDVGRHNALDKLIGACLRKQLDFGAGFCLVTSRCSFEMAQKAIAVGIPALIAISAPTALAIGIAEKAGLTLVALARRDSQTIYSGARRIVAGSTCHDIEAKD